MMELNSIYKVAQNDRTRWARYAQGGDTYLTLSMLETADILQTVNNNLTEMEAFFQALLKESKQNAQELIESEFKCLLQSFDDNKNVGNMITIDFDNDLMMIQRNSLCNFSEYQIRISDAKAIHAWFTAQMPYFKPEHQEKRIIDFEDKLMTFLDLENEHLQNCRSQRLRFRDVNGSLNMSSDKLCEITKPEADNYYIDGDIYEYKGKNYTLRKAEQETVFVADDGEQIFCDRERLGSFLPDVASEGMAFVRVPLKEIRKSLSLKDLITAVRLSDIHLVHEDEEHDLATIVEFDSDTLTTEGQKAWADVLNAKILSIHYGHYGMQIECGNVSADRLSEFSLMLAGQCPSEDYENWIKHEQDEPSQDLSL